MVKLCGCSDVRMTKMDFEQSIVGVNFAKSVPQTLKQLTESLSAQFEIHLLMSPLTRCLVKCPAHAQKPA